MVKHKNKQDYIKMKRKLSIKNIFTKKITIYKWQFSLFGTLILCVGITIGFYLTLSGVILPIFAETQTSIIKQTDTDFSQGTLSDIEILGSGNDAVIQLSGGGGDDWYNGSWQYRKKITIDEDEVDDDLTNFPVLVSLVSDADLATNAQDDFDDILFADTSRTKLDHEIEEFDESTGKLIVWVRVPSLSSSTDTEIYLYYGNGSCSNQEDTEGVWDDDYKMVQHLQETSGTRSDSTANNIDGTPNGMSHNANGKINGADNFDGNRDYILMDGTSDFDLQSMTISCWTYSSNYDANMFMFEKTTNGRVNTQYSFFFNGGGSHSQIYFRTYGLSSRDLRVTDHASGPVDNQWNYIVATYDSSSDIKKIYVNNAEIASVGNVTGTINTNPNGTAWIGTYGGGVGYPFNGVIDEVHISSTARSAEWISTSYNNQNTPSDFYALAAEETSLSPSGYYESPANSNVIDLIWNGGWGDGTDESIAFSATLANVGANSSVTFQMRASDSAEDLSSASYQTVGIANSGTSFTRTKANLDALSIPTGSSGRYVQVKATLTSSDGITNPQLDDLTINYLYDDTGPETNASAIEMKKTATGDTVSQGDWTNSLSSYFSWTEGSDPQAGLKGYCLYLGTDSEGNPATSKGLLGTSPIDTTGTTCQFIIDATSIDFATTSYRGDPFLTSSSDSYHLNIKAIDKSDNIFSGSSASFNFRFDNTIPSNPAYISLPGDWVSTKAVTAYWSSSGEDAPSDSNSGLAGMQYRIGSDSTWYGINHNGNEDATDLLDHTSGSYSTVENPDYDNLDEGSNTMYFRTWDNAGNITTDYVTGTIKLNTVAPSVPRNLEVTPTDSTSNSYSFDWDPPTTYTGIEDNITYCYTINTAPSNTTCVYTGAGQTSLNADAYAIQPDTNIIYIVAKDEASNINYGAYASIEFTYSGTAPGIVRNIDVADISIKVTSNWKLATSWDTPTDIGAGIEEYKIYRSTINTTCSASLASFSEIGSTAGTSYSDTDLSQQTYYYCVKACDSANNCSAVSSTVNGYPDGKFTEAPKLIGGPSASSITTKRATLSWSTDRTCDSKISYGKKSGDYYDEEPSNSIQTTDHEIKLTSLDPGKKYYYRAKWTDEDGNTGQSEEKTLTTDDAPTVQEVKISTVGINHAVLKFTTKGSSKAKVYYGKSTEFGGTKEISTSTSEAEYSTELSGLEDGTKYYFKINTFDAEEDEYEGTILDFTTLPRPRISNVKIQQVKGTAQPTVLITWETNTEVSSIITYSPEGDSNASRDEVKVELVKGTHKMILQSLTAHTRYNLLVRGNDKAGNEASSDTHSFTTATDTRPPLISDLVVEGNNIREASNSNEQGSQLIVTWNTDELATSQVEFGEGTGTVYSQKTQENSKLTYNHLVVVSGLTSSKVYHLQAVSNDEMKNETHSIDTVTITPKATDNALDLVIINLKEVFGFLGNP